MYTYVCVYTYTHLIDVVVWLLERAECILASREIDIAYSDLM